MSGAMTLYDRLGGEPSITVAVESFYAQRHFNAVAGHLVQPLMEPGVDEELIGEVAAAVTPLSKDIVNTGAVVV